MSKPGPSTTRQRDSKKRLLVVSLIFLASGFAFWLATGSRRELLYKGKPISYWVDQACVLDTSSQAWVSRQEVEKIGRTAIPYLVQRMRTPNGLRGVCRWLRAGLPVSLQRHFPEVRSGREIREGAAMTVGLFGQEAAPAVRDLARLLPGHRMPSSARSNRSARPPKRPCRHCTRL